MSNLMHVIIDSLLNILVHAVMKKNYIACNVLFDVFENTPNVNYTWCDVAGVSG